MKSMQSVLHRIKLSETSLHSCKCLDSRNTTAFSALLDDLPALDWNDEEQVNNANSNDESSQYFSIISVCRSFFVFDKEAKAIASHKEDHDLIEYQEIVDESTLVWSSEEETHDHCEVEYLEHNQLTKWISIPMHKDNTVENTAHQEHNCMHVLIEVIIFELTINC